MATLSPGFSDLLPEVGGTVEPAMLVTHGDLGDCLRLRLTALDSPNLSPNRVAAGLRCHDLAFRLMLVKVYQP